MNFLRGIAGVAVLLLAVVSIAGDAKRSLSGEYQWTDGGDGALTAIFTPDGSDRFNVKFRFEFGGKRHEWKGSARGSLSDGSTVTGDASWGRRTWSFEAAIAEGMMRGKHTETTGERNYETGTFTLAVD